jgi:hypothetical protein
VRAVGGAAVPWRVVEEWAYVGARGILVDSFRDEAEVWKVALGWPDADDIEAAKDRGDRVVRVRIAIPEPEPARRA